MPKRTIELNKPEIMTDKKMRKFMWKRVVIDKETSNVANENLKGIDPTWQDKKVIWHQIEEYALIDQKQVEALFGTALKVQETAAVQQEEDAEGNAEQAQPEGPRVREFFDPQARDKVIPIIKHLPAAEQLLQAVDNLNDG